ncbi:MAG TPA: hypothetical protein VFX92_06815 [Candidatus Krumholzibacteria bacterium]|nr:hypothetical protein [Candidatus Krumholzibacteria bacterium]
MRFTSKLVIVAALACPITTSTSATSNPVQGPVLTVTGLGITPIVTSGLNPAPVSVDIAPGEPVSFCWTADASAYGGVVTAYRWGRDIADPDDPDQYEIAWTAFDGTETCSPGFAFFFGTHSFTIEVIDDGGNRSRAVITLRVVNPLPVEETTWGGVKALYR